MQPAPKRTRNPQGEGARLREELIEAAGRVLADPPTGGELSLRAVAREAGVAAPSVYLQFSDKTELVGAVVNHYFEGLRDAILAAIATAADPAARLRAGCLAYCRFGLDRPGAYHILFQAKPPVGHSIGTFGDPTDAGTRAFATLVDAVRACMADGIIRPGDAFRQSSLLWAAMHGYVTLVQARQGFPWQRVETFVDDLIGAISDDPDHDDRDPAVSSGQDSEHATD